ncbi:hypothetical protein OBBRIDRAFT_790020 [Obba rivulosa]|uniref:Uncharacterized protein n=1 Tax=Obba rivulosa TaxID=1052685 RepID=A0A8E2DQ14_9APHY|nr:hypothetical protein OBBRIDRAFT_790020 [Obba rivulosa]
MVWSFFTRPRAPPTSESPFLSLEPGSKYTRFPESLERHPQLKPLKLVSKSTIYSIIDDRFAPASARPAREYTKSPESSERHTKLRPLKLCRSSTSSRSAGCDSLTPARTRPVNESDERRQRPHLSVGNPLGSPQSDIDAGLPEDIILPEFTKAIPWELYIPHSKHETGNTLFSPMLRVSGDPLALMSSPRLSFRFPT